MINLKLRRVELGLNQTDLAEQASVSVPTISKIENGYIPSASIAKRLADVLRVNWWELCDNNYRQNA